MSTSTYRTLKALVLRRVEAGEIVSHGERTAVRAAIAEVVADFQERAHVEDASPRRGGDGRPARGQRRRPRAVTGLLDRDDVEAIQIQGDRIVYWTADGRVRWLAPTAREDELRQYVEWLLQASADGAQLDATTPVVSVGIGNGSRLSAKIAPVVDELTVSERQQVARRPTLAQLVAVGTLSPAAAGLLFALMQRPSRVVVAGAPGAGKTTLANALLAAVPGDRVVRVNEETRELTTPLTLGGYTQATDRPAGTHAAGPHQGRPAVPARPARRRGGPWRRGLRAAASPQRRRGAAHHGSRQRGRRRRRRARDRRRARRGAHQRRDDPTVFARCIEFVVFLEADDGRDEAGTRRQAMEICWVQPELRGGHVVCEPLFMREELGLPLEWTGAGPPPALARRIETGLARAAKEPVALKAVLAGERLVGGVR